MEETRTEADNIYALEEMLKYSFHALNPINYLSLNSIAQIEYTKNTAHSKIPDKCTVTYHIGKNLEKTQKPVLKWRSSHECNKSDLSGRYRIFSLTD